MTKLELSKQFRDYPDVLGADQASELLGVSTKQVYRLLRRQITQRYAFNRERAGT